MFGGNSNWRGPVWMPVNYLLVRSLAALSPVYRRQVQGRVSDRSGPRSSCRGAPTTSARLSRLFLEDPTDAGRAGGVDAPERPRWHDNITVQRVLPRRQRRRAGRQPPDRLDRPGRRPDLPADPFAGGGQPCGRDDPADRIRTRGVRHVGPRAAREWLVTDGLGGYACGTVAGCDASLPRAAGPGGDARGGARRLGLAALDTVVVVGDRRIRLATHEWTGGVVDPRGHEHLPPSTLTTACLGGGTTSAGSVEVELAMTHGRRRRSGASPSRGPGAPRSHPVVHLARPARRTVRRSRPHRGRDPGRGLRVRVGLPVGGPRNRPEVRGTAVSTTARRLPGASAPRKTSGRPARSR